MNNLLAQNLCVNGSCFQGPLDPTVPWTVGSIVNLVYNMFLIPLASVILLFVLIWGGYDYLLSQGAPDKIKSAQAKITSSIIGFALLVLSFFIVQLISKILGLQQL